MRRRLLALLALVAAVTTAAAQDDAPRAADLPEGWSDWIAVEDLLREDRPAEADARARAAPPPTAERLAAYVASRRGREPDAAAFAALAATREALAAKDPSKALLRAGAPDDVLDSVVRIRLAFERASVLHVLKRTAESIAEWERAARAADAIGWTDLSHTAYSCAGVAVYGTGDFEDAVRLQTASLERARAAGRVGPEAYALHNLGLANSRLCRYAVALRCYEESLARKRELPATPKLRTSILRTLTLIARVHLHLGEHPEALRRFEEALDLARKLGDDVRVGVVLHNLAFVRSATGDQAAALRAGEEALVIHERSGNWAGACMAYEALGTAHGRLGDWEEALRCHEAGLRAAEEHGLAQRAVMALAATAVVCERMGKDDEAWERYARASSRLDASSHPATRARVLRGQAEILLRRGKAAESAALAREAAALVLEMASGLAEEEGASGRDVFIEVFDVGIRASARAGDPAALAWFLESARAGALREALGSARDVDAGATAGVPLTHETLAVERAAADAHRRAIAEGDLDAIRSTKTAWETAQADVQAGRRRSRREAKADAAARGTRVDDLATLAGRLGAHDALVLYGVTDAQTVALVVRRDASRIVDLGASGAIEAALDGFLLDAPPFVDPAGAAAVRDRVVEPLGLDPEVTRVLVSPAGRLTLAPFATLLAGREVAFVPSGTVLGLLAEPRAGAGRGVLAFGDPDYRATAAAGTDGARGAPFADLTPLPATRKEVEAVGTSRLLGADARESVLAEALSGAARWRAVHFACHGFVDPARPMRSALALTADAAADGFLTVPEILELRVPADLVALSACETARGRIFRTEGSVGLAQSFMLAGASRVLCSLWRADDDASRAFMVRFYELWNPAKGPGLSAAAALRAAQDSVRADARWSHPRHWAGWVLWGLPD